MLKKWKSRSILYNLDYIQNVQFKKSLYHLGYNYLAFSLADSISNNNNSLLQVSHQMFFLLFHLTVNRAFTLCPHG